MWVSAARARVVLLLACCGEGRDQGSVARLIDLVEDAAVVEMLLLCCFPATKHIVDGKGCDLRKVLLVRGSHLGIGRAIEVLRSNLLAFRRVEVLQISLRL